MAVVAESTRASLHRSASWALLMIRKLDFPFAVPRCTRVAVCLSGLDAGAVRAWLSGRSVAGSITLHADRASKLIQELMKRSETVRGRMNL